MTSKQFVSKLTGGLSECLDNQASSAFADYIYFFAGTALLRGGLNDQI